jgi:hypothetical protein
VLVLDVCGEKKEYKGGKGDSCEVKTGSFGSEHSSLEDR